jgi:hypothetical protein
LKEARVNFCFLGLTKNLAELKVNVKNLQRKEEQNKEEIQRTAEIEKGLNRKVEDLECSNYLLTNRVNNGVMVQEYADRVRTENTRLTQDLAELNVNVENLQRQEKQNKKEMQLTKSTTAEIEKGLKNEIENLRCAKEILTKKVNNAVLVQEDADRVRPENTRLTQELAESKEKILTQQKKTQVEKAMAAEIEIVLNRANREVDDLKLANDLLTQQKVNEGELLQKDADLLRTENSCKLSKTFSVIF